MLSLSETVTPARGPTGFRSIAAALSRASSSNSSSQAWISGSTRAVRARADSTTSSADTSPPRTLPAISSAVSSQSSPILPTSFHGGHEQEAVQGGRRIGQELLARQAFVSPVLRFASLDGGLRLGADLIALKLIDIVHDLAELADEEVFFLGSETKPGERGDFPYFFDV